MIVYASKYLSALKPVASENLGLLDENIKGLKRE